MSNELEFRKTMRKKRQKQKNRRNLIVALFSLFIIIVLVICVKSIFSQNEKTSDDTQFIFNGYIYPEPPPKNPDILIDAQNSDGKKIAYLTFDDGPNNSVTIEVLDILRKYNIKATFFLVGSLIEKNPDAARRLYDEGHLLANHSYTHQYSELYATKESFMNQINQTQALINKITGDNNYPKIIRFPGGSYNAGSHGAAKQEYKRALEAEGFRYCDWNSLTGDSEIKDATSEALMDRLKSSSKGKEDLVILMHDTVSKKITPKTLPELIEYLISEGYSFDTLDNI